MNKNVKILFGKPGAGKGTRLGALASVDRFELISVGNLLRTAVKNGTELGQKAKSYMDSGAMVPDDIINNIVIEGIMSSTKPVVTDGFPRTVGQAKAMLEAGIIPDMVIVLDVDDEVVVERSKDRIVCPDCGTPYTLNDFNPPKVQGICDKCGAHLVKRKDDEEAVVRNRLAVFSTETLPVLDVLSEAGVTIHTIDNTAKDAGEKFAELMNS